MLYEEDIMNTGRNGFVGNGQDNLPNIMYHPFKGQLCTCFFFVVYVFNVFIYGPCREKTGLRVVKTQRCLTRMEASLLTKCIITEKQSNKISTLSWNKENGSPLTYSQS